MSVKALTWNRVDGILKKAGLDSLEAIAKCNDPELVRSTLTRCLAQASIYASNDMDDSMFPPSIRKKHEEMIASIPAMIKGREMLLKDKEAGQMDFFV